MEGDIISTDGKAMRGTRNQAFEALHVASAWSKAQVIILAALESKGKSNESSLNNSQPIEKQCILYNAKD